MDNIVACARQYRPFIMGGNCNRIVKANIQATGPIDIGKGFTAYLAVNDKGKELVIESRSGALVGSSLDLVRKDIEDCEDIAVMEKQIVDAIEEFKDAEWISAEEFLKG